MEIKIVVLVIAALFWIIKKIVGFNKDTQYKGTDTGEGYVEDRMPQTFDEILKQFEVENRSFQKIANKNREEKVLTREDKIEQSAFSQFVGTNPDNVKLETPVKRRHLHYQIKKKKKNPYAEMFKNPKDVKKAFVGSLIFERKKY